MGGGSGGTAMKVAAKVAGLGFYGVFRGSSSGSLPEARSINIAANRVSSKPSAEAIVSSFTTTQSGTKTDASGSGSGSVPRVSVSSWENDDWEFAGDGEGLLLFSDSVRSTPRVVFGGVPTLEEAKEATSELKNALEKSSSIVAQDYGVEYSETKACITTTSPAAYSSASNPVCQAFTLLKGSPEAQNVVASLASDKNVWDAVMQNEKVMEFLKSQHTSEDCDSNENFSKSDRGEEYGTKHPEGSESVILQSVQKFKHRAEEIMSDLSTFVQNMFGGNETGNISIDDKGNAVAAYVNRTIGVSFMALAIMAIMLVVLKRE